MKSNQYPFTVLVERDEEGYLVATIPGLRGCHTQAKSLDVLMRRVREAILFLPARRSAESKAAVRRDPAGAGTLMPRRKRVTGKELIKALGLLGFEVIRPIPPSL
jgi:predicted RNase H-like HicB family nuclease